MKNIRGKSVSYKLDWLTIALRFRTKQEKIDYGHFDVEKELIKRGYPVREPNKEDELTSFTGYNLDLSKIVRIGDFDFTLLKRQEFDKVLNKDMEEVSVPSYVSGLIVLGGNSLTKLGIEKAIELLSDLEGISYLTRCDVACDVSFKKEEDAEKALFTFAEAAGLSPDYKNMMFQNPDNRLASGLKNKKSPIKTASIIASNGATVYIGGRESKFMIRAYNKRAEVMKKSKGEKDPGPLMRVEIVAKEELAEASRKMILSSKAGPEETLKRLWHNLANDRITIKKEIGSKEVERLGEFMDIGSATKVNLDYIKYEGDTMEYEEWVKKMVVPKFHRLGKEKSPKEKVEQVLNLFMAESPNKEDKEYLKNLLKNLSEN